MDNKNIFKLGIILLLICAISTGLLAVVNHITLPVIELNNEKAQEEAKKEILPLADTFKELGEGVYEGEKDGKTVGYTVNVAPKGYGGTIEMMVGINSDMTVSGVKILSMSETPGLGAKAQNEDFISQYKGKNKNLTLKKSQAGENEINAISGATVTSTAVTDGVNEAFRLLEKAVGGK